MNAETITSDPLLYTERDYQFRLHLHNRRTRRAIRLIWVITMVLTVMIAASVRRQQFVAELPWFAPAIAGVLTNMATWFLAVWMMFGRGR